MTPWLWPFLLSAIVLVIAFSTSLQWATHSAMRPTAHRRAISLGLVVGVPLCLVALYATLGHPRALDPSQRQPRDAADEAMAQRIDGLAARLSHKPGDIAGWLMLARSRRALGQHAEAAQAFEQADALDVRRVREDPDRLTDWIESRMLAADQHFDALSLNLLAQAMARAPQHPGVLLLRGLAALDRGDRAAATRAFTTLRDQHAAGSPDRDALDDALSRLARGEDPRRHSAPPNPEADPGSRP